jgi:hypothetical protein
VVTLALPAMSSAEVVSSGLSLPTEAGERHHAMLDKQKLAA